MKWLMNIAAVAVGLMIGSLFGPATEAGIQNSSEEGEALRARSRIPLKRNSASQLIRDQSGAFDMGLHFRAAHERMRQEKSSPLRSRSFLSHRINLVSLEDLTQDLADGHIRTHEELRQAAIRMTTEDHELTWDLIQNHKIRADGMDAFYVFALEAMKVLVNKDPEWLLKRLKTYERGGTQQSTTLHFSNMWARHDPKAAAGRFEDLVYMRNMTGGGSKEFGYDKFANNIVRSWLQKDKVGFYTYLENLPNSRKYQSLERAAQNIRQVNKE